MPEKEEKKKITKKDKKKLTKKKSATTNTNGTYKVEYPKTGNTTNAAKRIIKARKK